MRLYEAPPSELLAHNVLAPYISILAISCPATVMCLSSATSTWTKRSASRHKQSALAASRSALRLNSNHALCGTTTALAAQNGLCRGLLFAFT